MTTTIIIGIAFGTFVLGLIFSPNRKSDCDCLGQPKFIFDTKSASEAMLERENQALRYENSNLRWQYDKLRSYGGRECCEHCERRYREMNTTQHIEIIRKVKESQVKAEELAKELAKIK